MLLTSGNVTSHRRADMDTISQKRCTKCGEWKDVSLFNKDIRKKDGLHSSCKSCKAVVYAASYQARAAIKRAYSKQYRIDNAEKVRAYGKKYNQENKDKVRKYGLKSNYGLSMSDYEELLKAQGGGCAICGTTKPNGNRDVFFVDHDHDTGVVRGLLCAKCNSALGFMQDDIGILGRAIAYLKKYAKL